MEIHELLRIKIAELRIWKQPWTYRKVRNLLVYSTKRLGERLEALCVCAYILMSKLPDQVPTQSIALH